MSPAADGLPADTEKSVQSCGWERIQSLSVESTAARVTPAHNFLGMEVLRPRSQREKLHPIPHVNERDQRGDECQIVDRTADGDPQLVTIDHSGKVSMLTLPVGS